ncbi:ThiF family adenylyltransferase [Frigoribacterium sp. CFBP 8754]|uniref:ThiF family adenylyltransferase n=1 Tax=Frigoribacterium sp. CFBP 8754 TaxID=2775290 RepID=UPI00178091D4|nr:ThiF family adenylyltransferase [Frigoribacterium sp. CFBP 8754]MBD8660273.1 ThiF family adenylyltransferase [Frigoribacterium sp. CFBP 8754]
MSSLPPLVSSVRVSAARAAAGPEGSATAPEDDVRWSRSVRLPGFGLDAQGRLRAARVLVVGAGGLGAPVVQYLAASGVGTLGMVDDDVVDRSNLQRQVLFSPSDVGRPKAHVAAERVRAAAPEVEVVVHPVRLTAETASLLDGYDLVVDGSDSFDTCYLVADEAAARGLPVVWGSVSRFDGQVSVFWDAAPDGRAVDYRDLHPAPPASGWDESCADVGVLGPLCGTVGGVMASEAVKLLTGVGEPLLGRVVTLDALGGSWRESRLRRAPHRAAERERAAAARRQADPEESRVEPSASAGPVVTTASPAAPVAASEARAVGPDVSADDLAELLTAREEGVAEFTLLDVREPDEHDFAHLPGDVTAPGLGVRTRQRPELDPAVPVIVYCARGPRARAAADLLAGEGFDVAVLDGGMLGWQLRADAAARR